MKKSRFLVTCFLLVSSICLTIVKAQNYVVVLSLDGFRWDYPEMYQTPNLDMIAKEGVKAASLIPSFPSKTFPNHYTLATGLVPDHHGIISNKFYHRALQQTYRLNDRSVVENPAFYGGEPIWVSAEKQGVTTASFFWPGSEAPVKGIQPTTWKKYDGSVPFSDRIDSVIGWLKRPYQLRPKLITFYFDQPDGVGHKYGPKSRHTKRVVEDLDGLLGQLTQKLNALAIHDSINLIVVSDHGMGALSKKRHVVLSDYVKTQDIVYQHGSNPFWLLEAKEDKIEEVYASLNSVKGIKVWRKRDVPKYLSFGTNDNVSNLVIVADSAWGLTWSKPLVYHGGTHGYDPKYTDMHTIFYAKGPDFKKGYVHPSFKNTNVYAIIAEILKITPAKTDGDLSNVKGLLAR